MRKHLHRAGQVDDAETLQKPEGSDRSVKIQAGRKSRPKCEPEGLQRIHNLHGSSGGLWEDVTFCVCFGGFRLIQEGGT